MARIVPKNRSSVCNPSGVGSRSGVGNVVGNVVVLVMRRCLVPGVPARNIAQIVNVRHGMYYSASNGFASNGLAICSTLV